MGSITIKNNLRRLCNVFSKFNIHKKNTVAIPEKLWNPQASNEFFVVPPQEDDKLKMNTNKHKLDITSLINS